MNANEMAEKLNGIDYSILKKMKLKAFEVAKEHNLVVVFGLEYDLVEFEGALFDEAECIGSGTMYVDKTGLVKKTTAGARKIEALWCSGETYYRTFETDINHECFDVLDKTFEDDMMYCRGMVFHISELSKVEKPTLIDNIGR